ncbi:MAG: lytic transglycosylase domain-containing protein [Rhodobacterales bacterium]|nr:lytic transglycosylase domain-containing protein [Rhodobacterales bacterium]
MAADPQPFPEFTFKRVKPPKAGTQNRITIQIDPEAQAAATTGTTPRTTDQSAGASDLGQYDWFWQTVSPKLADTGPGRLRKALTRLANPPSGSGITAPRLQALQEIAQAQGVRILRETIGTDVSPALVLAVISVESGGRVDAVSGAGATGLMQLMPATATRFGVEDATSAVDNIKGGVAFLDFLMGKFDRDPILVLAGYNAGENSIATHDGVPAFAETRNYVPRVLAAYNVARGLCMTPPQLITDGCVFRVMK